MMWVIVLLFVILLIPPLPASFASTNIDNAHSIATNIMIQKAEKTIGCLDVLYEPFMGGALPLPNAIFSAFWIIMLVAMLCALSMFVLAKLAGSGGIKRITKSSTITHIIQNHNTSSMHINICVRGTMIYTKSMSVSIH